ncbi:isochorismate synthase [Kitasatospora sp. NPDC054939]
MRPDTAAPDLAPAASAQAPLPAPAPAPEPWLGPAARGELLDLARRAVAAARARQRPVLAGWAAPLAGALDPAELWCRGRELTGRSLLWESAWDGTRLTAFGTAHDLTGRGEGRIAAVRESWRQLAADAVTGGPAAGGPLLVGGFSFAADSPGADTPGPLPEALLWVPALQLRAGRPDAPGSAELRLNALVLPTDDPGQLAKQLTHLAEQYQSAGPAPRTAPPARTEHRELPSADAWQQLVREAVERIGEGAFTKVVLARELRVTADTPFDVPAAVRRLSAAYPGATVFAVEENGHAFIGATPEYLARVAGGTVHTLALAGTAPRGADPEQDAALARELADSPKIRHEHDVVVRMLRDALADSCTALSVPDTPAVLRLANVQHLATPVEGRLARSAAGVLEFVDRLHPTPALGGHPRAEALDWLTRHEGLARGWYAGAVGWTDPAGAGEFAVAIRSALIRTAAPADGRTTATGAPYAASLYAGCGLVAGSDPAEEYAETRAKLRPMLHALGLD